MRSRSRPARTGRSRTFGRIGAGAGSCVLLFSTASATHGESLRGGVPVSATVVETCRASLSSPSRPASTRPAAAAPPPELEISCQSERTRYEVIRSEAESRAREEEVRSCPGCDPVIYTTIIF